MTNNSSASDFLKGLNEPALLMVIFVPIAMIIVFVILMIDIGPTGDEDKFRNFSLANNPEESRKKHYPKNLEYLCFQVIFKHF